MICDFRSRRPYSNRIRIKTCQISLNRHYLFDKGYCFFFFLFYDYAFRYCLIRAFFVLPLHTSNVTCNKLIMNTLTFPQITLSPNILERLSQKAACSGKSLKAYIEGLLSEDAKESPSPSGDPWFDNTDNIRMVEQSISQIKHGNCKIYTASELKKRMGI